MNKTYKISVEFEKFTKNYEGVREYSVDERSLRIVDKHGVKHTYNMSKVLAYHVEEE